MPPIQPITPPTLFNGTLSGGVMPNKNSAPLQLDSDGNLEIVGTVIAIPTGTQAVDNKTQLIPVEFDYIALSPTGTNPTTIVYKTGGSGGTTVATLTLTYDGNNNVQTVTRS